mmetsp:Transcript_41148/g.116477  ORF Transcript_41148/g.116477 Transcript_41148/m.116477 type:complete len:309 (+) Transcript_41148:1664-2590(+)
MFLRAPTAARTHASLEEVRRPISTGMPPASRTASRLSLASARFSRQFAASSCVRAVAPEPARPTIFLIPPASLIASWLPGCAARFAVAPSALLTTPAPRCALWASSGSGSKPSSVSTPPAPRMAARFSSLPAMFQRTSAAFSWTGSSPEPQRRTIFGIAPSSRSSALLPSSRARLASAPRPFRSASPPETSSSFTRCLKPPASRTADLFSSSTASCISALATASLSDSLVAPGSRCFCIRAEVFSTLVCGPLLFSSPFATPPSSIGLAAPSASEAAASAGPVSATAILTKAGAIEASGADRAPASCKT